MVLSQKDGVVRLDRRRFLITGAAALGIGAAASGAAKAEKITSSARIVIAGAGAAGLAMAARLSNRLEGARITLVDARRQHLYQPGYTLVAAGVEGKAYPVSNTADWVPRGVDLIAEAVAEIDPDGKTIVTESGKRIAYDYLVVATGLSLDYGAIEGMDVNRIGKDGIGSLYAGPEAALVTFQQMSAFTEKGGVGVFQRPSTEIKCAGAPLKYAFITDDNARRKGTRAKVKLTYAAHDQTLFSVPIVDKKVREMFAARDVSVVWDRELVAIDGDKKIATFRTPEGREELGYDFINVVPPMRAPDAVRNSPLSWQSGPLAPDGWVEVDKASLRHLRFANIFAVGDVAGVPKGKTAASVKWQVPVAADHIVAEIAGRRSTATYNGYTSCPLVTRVGRAMLVEFDYEGNLTPSFPGIIEPLEELWTTWLMEMLAFKPTYYAMLRGRA